MASSKRFDYGPTIAIMGSGQSSGKAESTRRPYHSPAREQRAEQTRERIIAAAATHFVAYGYAGTTMRSVATEANVAVPTIELSFGTKARLLKAAIDTATAGDNDPVPMLSRPWAARARATDDPEAFLDVFANVLTATAHRAAGLMMVALEAAPLDPDIAAVADQLMQQRQVMAAWLVDGLRRRHPLRDNVNRSAAIDTVWLLMDPAVFCRPTRHRHWTPGRFHSWFTDSVSRLLLDQPSAT
jgi:AcrR family transcriptional regulator